MQFRISSFSFPVAAYFATLSLEVEELTTNAEWCTHKSAFVLLGVYMAMGHKYVMWLHTRMSRRDDCRVGNGYWHNASLAHVLACKHQLFVFPTGYRTSTLFSKWTTGKMNTGRRERCFLNASLFTLANHLKLSHAVDIQNFRRIHIQKSNIRQWLVCIALDKLRFILQGLNCLMIWSLRLGMSLRIADQNIRASLFSTCIYQIISTVSWPLELYFWNTHKLGYRDSEAHTSVFKVRSWEVKECHTLTILLSLPFSLPHATIDPSLNPPLCPFLCPSVSNSLTRLILCASVCSCECRRCKLEILQKVHGKYWNIHWESQWREKVILLLPASRPIQLKWR